MPGLDIFSGDAFSTFELTDAISGVPHKPSYLGGLKLFDPRPVRTEKIAIERRDGRLRLIQTTPRGAPLPQATADPRSLREFRTVRVAKGDRINASEIQGVRALGSSSELQEVQDLVMERMIRLRDDAELTHENMRLGAIRGVVTDADGSVLVNWYDEWDIAPPTPVSLGLNNVNADVSATCNGMTRAMARAAKGSFTPETKIIALAGDNLYDKLIGHPQVRQTYLNWQAAAALREGLEGAAFGSFNYGGIHWVNYRGSDDGAVGISPNEAQLFPVGARGIFQVAWSPGESLDWVNTPGREIYAIQVPDTARKAWVDVEVYSYPLYICTCPQVLLRAEL